MQFDIEAHTAKLELRIMELEDTTRAIVGVIRTIGDMLSHMNEMMNHYADSLGGMMLSLPSVAHKLPLWPVASAPPGGISYRVSEGNGGCCGQCGSASDDTTPTPST